MGTALTGTTPQDTYDSLIKVTDNGPISGSLKVLSDGLGNDSTLSLSTTAASIAGTLAVTGNLTIDTSTLVVDAANNRVGIATNSPYSSLTVGTSDATAEISSGGSNTHLTLKTVGASGALRFFTIGGGTSTLATTESMRITPAGNVGIGTDAPAEKLSVAGAIITTGGITGHGASRATFSQEDGNGAFLQSYGANISTVGAFTLRQASSDFSVTQVPLSISTSGVLEISSGIQFPATQVASAGANTLDDYEEGTWTPSISFGGASVGVTYSAGTSARYTKIGRQVSVTCYILLTSKGSSTGAARIGGLPFTIANAGGFYSAGSLAAVDNTTYGGQIQTYGDINTTNFVLNDISEAGVQGNITDANFTNGSQLIFSATYFV